MTRIEALMELVSSTVVTQRTVDAFTAIGVTEDEILEVRHRLWMRREMGRIERLSPFWRGEEMGT